MFLSTTWNTSPSLDLFPTGESHELANDWHPRCRAPCVLLYGAGIYNRLVTLKNRFANSFSQIEVQLKRRYDLIPNLVETVKAYMAHERTTLEAVVSARTRAVSGLQQAAANPGDASAMRALSGAEQGLSVPLGGCLPWPSPTRT